MGLQLGAGPSKMCLLSKLSSKLVFWILQELCYRKQQFSNIKIPKNHLQNCRFGSLIRSISQSAGPGICILTKKCPRDSGRDGSPRAVWEMLWGWSTTCAGEHIHLKSSFIVFLYLFKCFISRETWITALSVPAKGKKSLPAIYLFCPHSSISSEPPGLENSLYRTLHFRYHVLIIISN